MAMDLTSFGRFSRTFQKGEIIFSEFEIGDTFYLIQSGRVQLVKLIGDIERTLDILQPSEMFGEMAILKIRRVPPPLSLLMKLMFWNLIPRILKYSSLAIRRLRLSC